MRGLPFAARVLILFGGKQLQKALGDRGTGACGKETNISSSGCGRWERVLYALSSIKLSVLLATFAGNVNIPLAE